MNESENPFSDYMTKRELAEIVPGGPVTERTLDNWHARRIGPPRVKVGRTVLYPKAGVRDWLKRESEKDAADFEACV